MNTPRDLQESVGHHAVLSHILSVENIIIKTSTGQGRLAPFSPPPLAPESHFLFYLNIFISYKVKTEKKRFSKVAFKSGLTRVEE